MDAAVGGWGVGKRAVEEWEKIEGRDEVRQILKESN